MGCDIHAVVEYKEYDSYSDFGEVNIRRDYELFSALAFGEGGITDDLPHPPRGLPDDLSLKTHGLFYWDAEELRKFYIEVGDEDADDFQPEEIAKGWGDWALKEYLETGGLPGPDWHTPSWLNLTELAEALAHAKLEVGKQSSSFRAVLAAMEVLSESRGPDKVRLVFWFDG